MAALPPRTTARATATLACCVRPEAPLAGWPDWAAAEAELTAEGAEDERADVDMEDEAAAVDDDDDDDKALLLLLPLLLAEVEPEDEAAEEEAEAELDEAEEAEADEPVGAGRGRRRETQGRGGGDRGGRSGLGSVSGVDPLPWWACRAQQTRKGRTD